MATGRGRVRDELTWAMGGKPKSMITGRQELVVRSIRHTCVGEESTSGGSARVHRKNREDEESTREALPGAIHKQLGNPRNIDTGTDRGRPVDSTGTGLPLGGVCAVVTVYMLETSPYMLETNNLVTAYRVVHSCRHESAFQVPTSA